MNRRAIAALLALVAPFLFLPASALADGGPVVGNPGTFTFTTTGGGFVLGPSGETGSSSAMVDFTPAAHPECDDGEDNDGDGAVDYPFDGSCTSADDHSELAPSFVPKVDVTLHGTVDAAGTLHVPQDAMAFPTTYFPDGSPGSTTAGALRLSARADAAGTIDPASGATTLTLTLQMAFDVPALGFTNCLVDVPPITLTTGTTAPPPPIEPLSGVPYASDGTVTLVDNSFSVPAVKNPISCGVGLTNPMNLPAAAGRSSLTLAGRLDPVVAAPPGVLAGTVTAAGDPVAGARLRYYAAASSVLLGQAFTGPDGTYLVEGLPPGAYRVRVTADGYAGQFWSDKRSFAAADVVTVVGGGVGTADFVLEAPAPTTLSLAGTVTGGGHGVSGAVVRLYDSSARIVTSTVTAGDGSYRFDTAPGSYRALVIDGSGIWRSPRWVGGTSFAGATAFDLTVASVSGADVELVPTSPVLAGVVSGSVIEDGAPAAGLRVMLYDGSAQAVATVFSRPDGTYSFAGVEPGTYFVRVRELTTHDDAWWEGADRWRTATPIAVGAGADVTSIDLSVARRS